MDTVWKFTVSTHCLGIFGCRNPHHNGYGLEVKERASQFIDRLLGRNPHHNGYGLEVAEMLAMTES